MQYGQMMDQPLLISSLLQHAEQNHADAEIVSRLFDGTIHRYSWADTARRARQLANALQSLGVEPGQCIGTMAWNTYRHLEAYFAISGIGAICHTVNHRLFADQISYIINHAEDRVLMFDACFLPQVEQLAPDLPHVRHWILLGGREHMPTDSRLGNLLCYEDLVGSHSDSFDWPQFDEQTASSLCYTSGTTGHPKGVLYAHRSTVLHALASSLPDAFGLSAQSCILPVVPMFHVNGWGLPYSAALNGAKLVLPGSRLDAVSVYQLIEEEEVNLAAGVPTVWLNLLQHCETNRLRLHHLKRVVVGGSAVPDSMIEHMAEQGVELRQLWGMTEMSPCGTMSTPKFKHRHDGVAGLRRIQGTQGRPLFGVQMRIVDGAGQPLPHDGVAFGNLQVRGPWVLSQYFKRERDASHTDDGWFNTGDVAKLDADGYMRITDRTKDVIKSGGEWISSIELENIIMGHPAVAEAAAIGVVHPKWDERPVMVVVLKPDSRVTREELLQFYEGKVAKWWTPDDVIFVDELPHTATGKLQKLKLREKMRDYQWPQ
ncbi:MULTISPECIES: 3-(methylthio)propionyl-CoA ligase [unclassified Paludibacterium]|uniref:3-(methylthio)propionyl-CoA ligase n=1 Tax=unclassified Paludibacterium TaxID=2618429 RepID=UPI001C03CE04|nr:3-(methylthio)propionyl-CoA ligase [Paludibacterium sp. B53371]BEV73244.1 3-(methylthio)propionyl-CoA ligase [Paludibacterium sp. THUN1379]